MFGRLSRPAQNIACVHFSLRASYDSIEDVLRSQWPNTSAGPMVATLAEYIRDNSDYSVEMSQLSVASDMSLSAMSVSSPALAFSSRK